MSNNEVLDALSGVFYLATTDEDQPHVRPFDKAAEIEGKIYIGTAKHKRVFAQISENPKVEIYAQNEFGATRFVAEAVPEIDEKIAKEAFEKMGKMFEEGSSVAIELRRIRKS